MNSHTSLSNDTSQSSFYHGAVKATLDTYDVLETSLTSLESLNRHQATKKNREDQEKILTKKEIKKIAQNPKHRLIQRQVIYVIGIIPEIANQKVNYPHFLFSKKKIFQNFL